MPENDDRSWEANRLLIHKELETNHLQNKALVDQMGLMAVEMAKMATQVANLNKVLWWGLGIAGTLTGSVIIIAFNLLVKLAPLAK